MAAIWLARSVTLDTSVPVAPADFSASRLILRTSFWIAPRYPLRRRPSAYRSAPKTNSCRAGRSASCNRIAGAAGKLVVADRCGFRAHVGIGSRGVAAVLVQLHIGRIRQGSCSSSPSGLVSITVLFESIVW